MNKNKAPLSRYARIQLNFISPFYFAMSIVVIVIVPIILWILFGHLFGEVNNTPDGSISISLSGYPILAIVAIVVAMVCIGCLLWYKARIPVIAMNEFDFHRSHKVKEVFGRFSQMRSNSIPVSESQIHGSWRPYKIEPFVGTSNRGTFTGEIDLLMSPFAFLFGGSISGTVDGSTKGRSAPNLLDRSTSILLKDADDNTLRLHVPSPQATKEMLVGMVEMWCTDDIGQHSHTHRTLNKISLSDDLLVTPISNQQLIDRIEISLDHPFENRPEVQVTGKEIEPGVVLVTSLGFEGKQKMFFPSGFFNALQEQTSSALEAHVQAPQLTTAVERT